MYPVNLVEHGLLENTPYLVVFAFHRGTTMKKITSYSYPQLAFSSHEYLGIDCATSPRTSALCRFGAHCIVERNTPCIEYPATA